MLVLRFFDAVECVKEVETLKDLNQAEELALRYLYEDFGMCPDVQTCIIEEDGVKVATVSLPE